MPIRYKIDIISALKAAGYSSYRIRKEKVFSEGTLQAFRENRVIASPVALENLCRILKCQPGDLLIYEDEVSELKPMD